MSIFSLYFSTHKKRERDSGIGMSGSDLESSSKETTTPVRSHLSSQTTNQLDRSEGHPLQTTPWKKCPPKIFAMPRQKRQLLRTQSSSNLFPLMSPNKTSSCAGPRLFLTHSVSTRKNTQTHLLHTSITSIAKIPPSRSLK